MKGRYKNVPTRSYTFTTTILGGRQGAESESIRLSIFFSVSKEEFILLFLRWGSIPQSKQPVTRFCILYVDNTSGLYSRGSNPSSPLSSNAPFFSSSILRKCSLKQERHFTTIHHKPPSTVLKNLWFQNIRSNRALFSSLKVLRTRISITDGTRFCRVRRQRHRV